MPTIAELAAELGIEASTLKPEAIAKWNGYLLEADTKYAQASTLAATAQENLRKVQEEQDAINQHITRYGESEATNAALRANYAAMEAQLKTLKESGLSVNLPEPLPKPTVNAGGPSQFDPDKFRGAVSSTIGDLTDLNNKYFSLYGKPLPVRSNELAEEARKAGKPLYEYGASKFDFAGEEKRKADAAQAEQQAKWEAEGVRKYQEKFPNMANNPDAARGINSVSPQMPKREGKDQQTILKMDPRQRIAASVAATREAINRAQA